MDNNFKDIGIIEKDKDVGGLASNMKISKFKLEKFYHHWYQHDKEIFSLIDEIKCSKKISPIKVFGPHFFGQKMLKKISPIKVFKLKNELLWGPVYFKH